MKVLFLLTFFTYYTLAEDEIQCLPPNGGGMQAVFQEFVSKIPTEKIRELVANTTAYSPEVQTTVNYLSSRSFLMELDSLLYQDGMFSFMYFTCIEMYIDMHYNIKLLLRIIFSVQKSKSATPGITKHSGASDKLLLNVMKLIPFDEIKALFQEKVGSDIYLQYYNEKVNSKEFKSIVKTAKSSGSYEHLKNDLHNAGVDITYINEIIRRIFFEI